jgi:SNF2 family DNA or RNA helicase
VTVRKRWEPGTVVRIKATGDTAAVLRMLGDEQAEVLIGSTRLVVHVDDVEAVGEDPLGSLVKGEEPGRSKPFGLRLQATYLLHAYRYDPRSGLSNARIEPQLHQLSVAHRVAEKLRPRMILADEVGLGKTIEAGLILKEFRARGLVERVLIVTPASLQQQWQAELRSKFNERFEIIDGPTARFLSQAGQNPWAQRASVICSLNIAVRWAETLGQAGWDLIIFDEAHKVRRSKRLGKVNTTKAYELADALKDDVFGLLLLTATPMQLSPYELYSLIDLVEPGLYVSEASYEQHRRLLPGLNDLMKSFDRWPALTMAERAQVCGKHAETLRRLGLDPSDAPSRLETDSELTAAIERLVNLHPLAAVLTRNRKSEVGGFKKRIAHRQLVTLTRTELDAYESVSEYLRNRYLRSENTAIGFLMVTYQKMLASSSFALKQSLLRRLAKLRKALEEHEAASLDEGDLPEADDDMSDEEFDHVLSLAESMTGASIQEEIDDIIGLLPTIDAISDTKLERLCLILDDLLQRQSADKVLVFTQFTDTQRLIAERLRSKGISVTTFNGGMDLAAKEEAVRQFRGQAQVMVSTEAGGEGRNFQFAHQLVNYDLPWNPMKVEQRIGRLDRIGQTHDVVIFNLACAGTIEERVLEVLENRIRLFEESVGALDPILGSFESEFTAIAMAAPPVSAAEFKRIEDALEGRVREAHHQERLFADLLLDRASLRRDQVNRLLDTPPLATPNDLHTFSRDLLEYSGGSLEPHWEGGDVIALSPQLAADLKLRFSTLRGTFDPAEALQLEEIDFFTVDHDVIGRLIRLSLSDDFPAIGRRTIAGEKAGEYLEVYYEVTAQGLKPRGRFVRHLVGPDLTVFQEDIVSMPQLGSLSQVSLPDWIASAAEASRKKMLEVHAAERVAAAEDEEVIKAQERARATRIFDYQARRLTRLVEDDETLAGRLERASETERRILPAIRGRASKNRDRLERLRHENSNLLQQIESRKVQVSFAAVAAAVLVVE